MHNLNLTDETFDVNQSHNYFLSMQSSLNGFSYAICDTVRNKCIMLKHFDANCSDWFEYKNFIMPVIDNDEHLNLSFKNIHHIVSQKDFTIIPEAFVSSNIEDLQKFFPGSDNSVMKSFSGNTIKSSIICPYPNELINGLQKKFPGIIFSHSIFPFICNLVNESSRTLRHVFHLMVYEDFIAVGVAHSTSLDFINTFKVETFEDILYFTISVLEKFKVSPSLAEIYFSNESRSTDIQTRLQAYIGKVRPLKASPNMVYSYIMTEEILERFANLLNLYHCE